MCGCSHYEAGYFTGYRRIAEEQFDFVFHTGDYIYEGRADGGRNPNVGSPASRPRNLHRGRLSQPLRPVQVRSAICMAAHAVGAVHRDLGRS